PINSSQLNPRYKDTINDTWADIEVIKAKLRKRVLREIASVVQAMGGAAGHWFKCSKGHHFYIGECGGAMQRGICIECKEVVGGSHHQLVSTSSHSDIDGSVSQLYKPMEIDHNQLD
ncbi:hypothetical protein CYY_010445, partial [Polysphondylium violaceum]